MGGGIMGGFASLMDLLFLVLLVFKVFTLIDAAMRPQTAYVATGKQTKQFWLIILALTVIVDLVFGGLLSFLSLIGLIAAIVYFVDVRPALREIGGPGRGGKRNMGPYGPW